MTATATKKLTKAKLVKFFEDFLKSYGETVGTSWDDRPNVIVMTGKEGKRYSEYSRGKFHVIFEESWIYGAVNYPEREEDYHFGEAFTAFLKDYGLYYERGHSWDFDIYNG